MKVLVLGGNGFIGSHLVDALRAEGATITVFDRSPERYREPFSDVHYVTGELGNTKQLASLLPGTDAVVHLASTTLPATSNETPSHDIQSNLVDTVRLLEECVKQRVGRFVFLSSGGTVYGRVPENPVTEDHPTHPLCSYGIVKLSIERYLELFQSLHGLDYVVLRPGNPVGERQSPSGVQGAASVFLGRVAAGLPVEIWGDGEVVRDFFYVGDLAAACVRAATTPRANRIYNIGSGQGISINQLVSRIETLVGHSIEVHRQPERGLDVPALFLDASRAADELGWRPRVDLDEALSRTWRWLSTLG